MVPSRSDTRSQIYFMAKPRSLLAQRIHALPRAQADRGAHLLHMTLWWALSLADVAPDLRDAARGRLIGLGDALDGGPFPVAFDKLWESDRAITLRGRAAPEARTVIAAIRAALTRAGFDLRPYRFNPHITISYQPDGLGNEPIEPFDWLVDEIVLIESVVGEGRHIELGRWSLRPRQGELFH